MSLRTLNIAGSTNIEGGSYDDETGELVIDFVGGRTYRYSGVPAETAAGLEAAPSAGSYWHRHKSRYPYVEE